MFWAPGSIWKVFQLVRANFEQFGAGPVTWGGLTAWCRRSNRPGQSEQNLALCLSLAFDRLLRFLFICSFSFSFLFDYQILCVVNAIIKGHIEDHVWSRTGAWSLPSVMSD
jgi:hypothetical protein